MNRSVRLSVDCLEERVVPAVFGNAWADPGHLSVSFAPDGTHIGERTSTLAESLGQNMSQSEWQGALLRALQTWAQYANLNFHVVNDAGRPFGGDAPVQGSPYAGDIRFGARVLDRLAIANPFDLMSGFAGEVIFDSRTPYANNPTPGAYDLYTVALHEVGHALGVAHSDDPTSVMFESYRGPRTGLAAADIAAIQAIYGARTPDRQEGAAGNGTLSTATPITPVNVLSQVANLVSSPDALVRGDITQTGDVDIYRFSTGLLPLLADVALKTSDLSLLQAKITLLDSSGHVLASRQAGAPSGDLVISALLLGPLSTYYVKVEGAVSGSMGTGAYKLAVGTFATNLLDVLVPVEFETPSGTVADYTDVDGQHRNDSMSTATNLGVARPGSDARWDYAGHAKIDTLSDADFYRVRTRSDTPPVLVVTAFATQPGTLDPEVTVFDAAGNALAARVLRNDDYSYTIQVEGLQPNTDYYIRVRASSSPLNVAGAAYFLAIDFRQSAITLEGFASGQVAPAEPVTQSLSVPESASYRFELTAGASTTAGAAVRLILTDAAGRVVFVLTAKAGETVAGDVFLMPGDYTAHFEATAGPPITFQARVGSTTGPMGPETMDPVEGNSPPGEEPPPPPPPESEPSYEHPPDHQRSYYYWWSWDSYSEPPW